MIRSSRLVAVAAAFILLPLLFVARPAGSAQSSPESFAVDGLHSSVVFRIQHLGVSSFYGRFNKVSGGFTWDESDPANGSMKIEVVADSIDSNSAQRDNHLKGPDFFNAREFPKITFTSTSITATPDGTFKVGGKLTLHGVTKPITASVKWNGAKDTGERFGYRGGLDATFTIKRSDFGMNTYVKEGGLGDEVTIMVGLEGTRI